MIVYWISGCKARESRMQWSLLQLLRRIRVSQLNFFDCKVTPISATIAYSFRLKNYKIVRFRHLLFIILVEML